MSRSVKLDYEKLQNPGNTRVWKAKITRCDCTRCKRFNWVAWKVSYPTAPFEHFNTWDSALRNALQYNKYSRSAAYGKSC